MHIHDGLILKMRYCCYKWKELVPQIQIVVAEMVNIPSVSILEFLVPSFGPSTVTFAAPDGKLVFVDSKCAVGYILWHSEDKIHNFT